MHKYIKRLFFLILGIVLINVMSERTLALSNNNPLTITKYRQIDTLLCWAACAQMCGQYFECVHSQKSIVKHVKGTYVNQTASDHEAEIALKFAINNKYKVALMGVPLFATVKQHIKNNHYPIVAKIKWTNANMSHLEIISGTNASSQVYLMDPNSTKNEWVKYSKLKTGVKLISGTGKLKSTFRFSK